MGRTEEMKQMIQEEIRSINSLEERVIFKELMESVFLSLYETNERMYRQLEERVMDDLAYDINCYLIQTGLAERKYLDPSDHVMTAMEEEDILAPVHTAGEIRKKIKEEGSFTLTTVFLQSDFLEVKAMFEKGEWFSGIIRADSEYPIRFQLRPGRRYLDKIEHLYHLFLNNGVPWQTVNSPYLYKMAEVVITHLPEELPDQETVRDIRMDLGEHNHVIHYDLVPVWNVKRLKLDSIGFPVACEDHQSYEHVVSLKGQDVRNSFLIEEHAKIHSVRRNGEKLLVTGSIAKSQKWEVYMIQRGDDSKLERYAFPIMKNDRIDSFSERFQRKTGQAIKTRGELERFIRGLGLEDYVKYQNCAITSPGELQHETYSMNFFRKDEIRNAAKNRQLTLDFKSQGKELWLLRDLISFITSEVQELYPEYRLGGRLL